MSTTAAEKMTKARANLVMLHPFFGTLALRQRIIPAPGLKTMMTNGYNIWYDPAWVDKLSLSQVTGVIAHEVMHTACNHSSRMGDRDPEKWNVAGDYVINDILLNNNFDLPPCRLHDPQYANMSAEEVYSKLPPRPPGKGKGNPDPGGCGGVYPAPTKPGQTQAEANNELETEIKMAIAQAAHAARQRGDFSADLERLVGDILQPVIPWKQVLRRFATASKRRLWST